MTEFIRNKAGASEAQQKKADAFLFAQDSTGLATDGVLVGLDVTQTSTASGSVQIAAGSAIAQDTAGNGVSQLVNDTLKTLDVFTANPMGGVPRNDIVVFDAATSSIRAIIGTPNAAPTDPTVPATAVALARLRHAASATTIPTAKIDPLIVYTSLFGAKAANRRSHWEVFTGNLGSGGAINCAHGAPFTPRVILANDSEGDATAGDIAWKIGIGSVSATVVQFVCYKFDGTYLPTGTNVTIHAWFGE